MYDKKVQRMLLEMMAALNLVIILFLSMTIGITAERIAQSGQARAFFDQVSAVPNSPRATPIIAVSLFLLLLGTMALIRRNDGTPFRQKLLVAATLVLLIALMAALRMSYAGVVLLVAAELLVFFESRRTQTIFIGIMTVLFLCSDYDLISLQIPMVSFQDYLFYYNTNTANLLISTKNVLISINMLLFITVIVQMSLQRSAEHEKVIRLNAELGEANQRIMAYAIESERSAAIHERNRIAREIHDSIGHILTSISAGLDACITLTDRSPEHVREHLVVLADVSRSGLQEVRRSVHALGAEQPEHLVTAEVVRKMARDTEAASGVRVTLDSMLDQVELQMDEADTVYRIVQESMTNAIKHGGATEISIRIKLEGRWLVVIVHDNGSGCEDCQKGFGLRHMEERVALLGGRLRVKSFRGFTVMARLNIRWRDENDQGIDSRRPGADPAKPANCPERV